MGFSFGNAIAAVDDIHIRTCLKRLGLAMDGQIGTVSTLVRNNVSTSNIVAGAGLTGGGPLNAITSATLDVGAGTGITVTADAVSISSSYLGANPTGTIGISAVNGVATTYMRSDAAPAFDMTIARPWTAGIHTFSAKDVHSAGINLSTSGLIESSVANSGTNVGCIIRNTVALGNNRPLLSVQDSASVEHFQISAAGPSGGSTKRLRLLHDSSNYLEITVGTTGSTVFTNVGAIAPPMNFSSSGAVTFGGTSTIFVAACVYQATGHTSTVAAGTIAYTYDTTAARTGGVAAYKFSDNAVEILSLYPASVNCVVPFVGVAMTGTDIIGTTVTAKYDATHYIKLVATGVAEQTILLPTGTTLSIDKAVLFKSQVASDSIAFRRSDLGTGTYGASFDLTSTTVTLNTNHDPTQVQSGLVVQQAAAGSAGSKVFQVSTNAALVPISCDQNGDLALGVSGKKIGFFNHAVAAQPSAYTPSNVSADRSYDANSTTVDELADVLGTLIADLQSLGLVA